MTKLWTRLRDHPSRDKAQKWLESIGSLGAMTVLQLGGFILLARILGARDYAVIVGVASMVSMLTELVGLGSGDAMIRSVSRDPATFPAMIGRALALIGVTLLPVAGLGMILIMIFYGLDVAWYVPCALVLSELVSARGLALAEHMAIAHRDIRWANAYRVTPQVIRVCMIVTAFLLHVRSIEAWWHWQFIFGMTMAPLCVIHALSRYGRPNFSLRGVTLVDNFLFAATQQLRAMQFNVDRLFVGSFGNQLLLGQYGVAARLMQYSMLPLVSVLRITYPHYFQHGRHGLKSSYRFGLKVLAVMLGIAVPISAVLFFGAPFIARMLGPGFVGLPPYLRILSAVPLCAAVQYAFADMLTGADKQRSRTFALAAGVTAIAGLAWTGGKLLGVPGIAFGVVAANALLAFTYFAIVRWGMARTGRSEPIAPVTPAATGAGF